MCFFGSLKGSAEHLDELLTVFDKHSRMDKWVTWTSDTPTGKCPKCGSTKINVRYNPKTEKLNKECCRCDYVWKEDPLDKKKE